MVYIAIADDHEVVRSALAMMLKHNTNVEIAFEASSLTELLEKLEKKRCDVLMLDLNLSDSSGIATVEAVCSRFPKTNILVLSAYPVEEFAQRAFDAGAKGYLHKSARPDELREAIETLMKGKYYLNARIEEVLPLDTAFGNSVTSSLSLLSKREFEVLRLIAAGLTNNEIAHRLEVSPKTVSTYRSRMVEKLGLTSSSQLYRFALEYRLHLPM
jgi:DNA-binding NarL/FixJ family response regulator